jgi:hypothetical protein
LPSAAASHAAKYAATTSPMLLLECKNFDLVRKWIKVLKFTLKFNEISFVQVRLAENLTN